MKVYTATLLGSLASSVVAMPHLALMKDAMDSAPMEASKSKREASPVAEPQIGSSLIPTLPSLEGTISGLLGNVAESVDPANYRPEPGYDFIAPKPGDSRGPCPGLNTLANHGYLPRNGLVSNGQVLEAVSRGFNMGADIATILIVFATLADGNIATGQWYLGTSPTTGIGGLNRHSTVEADISVNREDFYNGCGDNHHLSSRQFANNVQIVASRGTKQFDIPAMAQHYSAQASFAKRYNPTLYYQPFPMIVSIVAYNFYPAYFSNGTYEFGGVANYESISSIVGAKYNKKHRMFEYVPERFPEQGWYRRAYEYGAVEALFDGYTQIFPANPTFPPGFDNIGPGHFNITNIGCNLYQGLKSMEPLTLAGEVDAFEAAITPLLTLLDKSFNNTLLGCAPGTYSADPFYPNPSSEGGPLYPPPSVQANAGNNVYNKIYFPTAPTSPTCNHTINP